jgi:hypothetical protein
MNYIDLGFDSLMQRTLLGPANSFIQYTKGNASSLGLILNPATDIVFSSTDEDTAAWTAGTIYFSDGSKSGQIAAGNTGTMTGVTYIYFDRNKAGQLLYTTDHESATGSGKVIIAIATTGGAGKKCKIIPTCGAGLIVSDITADQITAGTITTSLLTVGAKSFVSTLTWTATDADTATWSAGTITTTDGTSYSITGGNTGNIGALTYVYLDTAVSVTVLQTTTTPATAIGETKLPVAIIQAGASGSKCIIDVLSSNGTTIDGDRITTGSIASSDGKTYFDLDNDRIVINDGSDDRIVIGNI